MRFVERVKVAFFKALPLASGLLLGWLLVFPPDFLEALGWASWIVVVLLVLLLLLATIALIIIANLPADLQVRPDPEAALGPELRTLAQRCRALGFLDVGPPLRVGIAPPALLLGFVHEREPIYATAFQPGAVGAKPAFDFISILAEGRGGLTSAETPHAAVLPTRPGSLRQVFPQAYVETVYARHREALAFLRGEGIAPRAVSRDTFLDDLRSSIALQRRAFFQAPLRNTLIVLWRSVTRRSPELRSIEAQPRAQKQIRRLAEAG